MRFLDLMLWICFHSYCGWSKSSMYNGYLHLRFLHITCALCLCITYYVKSFNFEPWLKGLWLYNLLYFLWQIFVTWRQTQKKWIFFFRCQGIIVKISLNYFLMKIYPIQLIVFSRQFFLIYCRTWWSPIKRFSQIWLHHPIWEKKL
jgi:hypothetical protein